MATSSIQALYALLKASHPSSVRGIARVRRERAEARRFLIRATVFGGAYQPYFPTSGTNAWRGSRGAIAARPPRLVASPRCRDRKASTAVGFVRVRRESFRPSLREPRPRLRRHRLFEKFVEGLQPRPQGGRLLGRHRRTYVRRLVYVFAIPLRRGTSHGDEGVSRGLKGSGCMYTSSDER